MSETPDFYTKSGFPSRIKHGTTSAYINMRCRCDLCRSEQSKRVRAKKGLPPKQEPVHGDVKMYASRKCRCTLCKAGWAVYMKERKRIAKYSKTFEV